MITFLHKKYKLIKISYTGPSLARQLDTNKSLVLARLLSDNQLQQISCTGPPLVRQVLSTNLLYWPTSCQTGTYNKSLTLARLQSFRYFQQIFCIGPPLVRQVQQTFSTGPPFVRQVQQISYTGPPLVRQVLAKYLLYGHASCKTGTCKKSLVRVTTYQKGTTHLYH